MRILRLKRYLRAMRAMGFQDAEMEEFELSIRAAPEAHPMIKGLRGARKARIARPGMGKRGGGRVVYFLAVRGQMLAFLLAYPKNEKDDLTQDDRKALLRAIEMLTSGAEP
jgi:hypothetical protein